MKQKRLGSEQVAWNLTDLYGGHEDPRLKRDMATARADAESFAKTWKGKVSGGAISVASLKKLLEDIERIDALVARMGTFAELSLTLDNSDSSAKSLVIRMQELGSDVANAMVFFPIELNAMSSTAFDHLATDPLLAGYRHFLLDVRKHKKHLLTEKEEAIINKRDLSGKLAFQRMYEEVASSLRYPMTIDGKRKVLTGEQIRALRQRPDARLRTRAMKLYFTTYGRNSLVLTSIYNALLKDHQIECDLRHYDQAMDMRNLDNELDAAVVNTLSDVTNANVDIVQRYYRLKARMLHRGKLNMADLYAPVTDRSGMFTWDESKRIVLDAYRAFDKRAHDTIKEFFDHSWIDARTLPNKTGGAFCTFGVPGTHPFVMLNFTGTSRDVQTMAHELGHGMHSMLSAKQTMLNRNPILPLAEVASVFGEMLVTDHLLAHTSGAEEKIALYAGKLEDTFATAFRQNMFHCFEVRTHALVADHSLSSDELAAIYSEEVKRVFGDAVAVPDHYRNEWMALTHIFMWPFYVYAYNFAQLVVLSLYQKYLQEGERFKSVYYRILETGCAMTPREILALAHIDPADKAFWQGGFDFMRTRWLEPLEKLVAGRS